MLCAWVLCTGTNKYQTLVFCVVVVMRKHQVGQDWNSTGIKYPGAVDNGAIPRWMPWAFWIGVASGFMLFGGLLWWVF
jgi:hypothetical protein